MGSNRIKTELNTLRKIKEGTLGTLNNIFTGVAKALFSKPVAVTKKMKKY